MNNSRNTIVNAQWLLSSLTPQWTKELVCLSHSMHTALDVSTWFSAFD